MRKDMHIHTKFSKDCKLKPEDIVNTAKRIGLSEIAIVDHDTIKGGIETKSIAKGIKVIIGAEIKTDRGEVIGYNLSKEIESRDFFEVINEIKAQNAQVCIPHPFDFLRKASITDKDIIGEVKEKIDFLEINGRTIPFINNKVRKFAENENLPLIGGSDAHFLWEIGSIYTEVNEETKETRVVGNGYYWSLYPLIRTKFYKIFRI